MVKKEETKCQVELELIYRIWPLLFVGWRAGYAYRDELDALGGELLGGWLVHIASDGPDFEFSGEALVCEDGFDDGAALIARCAEDGDDLGHDFRFAVYRG
jgi:hypothetical protein